MSMYSKTKALTLMGLMTAILCILSPISIPLPFSPVPISLAHIAIFLTIYILGTKKALICYFLYLCIGCIGIPVFSNFSAGPGKLLGPTGGYLFGFAFMILISGLFISKFSNSYLLCFVGMCLGSITCSLLGTAWLSYQGHMDFIAAFTIGGLPFILGDIVKIGIVLFVAPPIRKVIAKI